MRVFGTAADMARASHMPVVNIENWDMAAAASIDVDVGYHYNTWRHICVMIRDDLGTTIRRLGYKGSLSGSWFHDPLKGDTILTLERKIGGDFDSVDYDTAVFNRGFIRMAIVP
ncbi:hypothetical protein ES708_26589 [subsurface metagenome]